MRSDAFTLMDNSLAMIALQQVVPVGGYVVSVLWTNGAAWIHGVQGLGEVRVVFNNARIRGQPKPRGNHTSPHSDTVPAKSPKILEECAEETHNADVNGSWVIYHPNVIPCFVSESFGIFHFLPSPKTPKFPKIHDDLRRKSAYQIERTCDSRCDFPLA